MKYDKNKGSLFLNFIDKNFNNFNKNSDTKFYYVYKVCKKCAKLKNSRILYSSNNYVYNYI